MGDARFTGAEHNMHDGQECDVRCATIAARFTNPPNVELATADCCALGSQTIVGINGSMVDGTSVIRTIVGIKRFGPAGDLVMATPPPTLSCRVTAKWTSGVSPRRRTGATSTARVASRHS